MMGRVSHWAQRNPLACLLILLAAPVMLALWTLPPAMPDYSKVRSEWRASEAWLLDRDGRPLDTVRVDFAVRRLPWTPIDRMAPALRDAVVAGEDKRFFNHGGVDWSGVAASLLAALHGKRARGASTITMQLAGLLAPELGHAGGRSWTAKVRQMRAARGIEAEWTKAEILETYLNLVSFRGETQGIGAASRALFGRAPDALTTVDALLLAALLPAPNADPGAVARRACRAGRLVDCVPVIAEAEAMAGPDRRLADDPDLAPHLAATLLRRPGERLRTTLSAPLQAFATNALQRQLIGLGASRARDGAVIIVDNASGDVLAYVGGGGGAGNGGSTAAHVDNAAAPRQAGSTLKPFLYALAIEQGYLTSASLLDDSPVHLATASGLYVPRDYDRMFRGSVSVRTALAGSLNVPAVRALLLTGVEPFRDRLWDLGYRGLTETGDFYGFSLALGSAEVTLMEQAAAYRALAVGGRYAPLRLRATDPRYAPREVASPAAAWITADMLADPDARAITFGVDSALRLPFPAAVKTGTSKAMRDNWCVGFSDRFTVAVWIGNSEGDGMTGVSGTSGAAPVWREVMLALHRDRPGARGAPPAQVETRTISYAGRSSREWFMRGTAQTEVAAAPDTARRPRISSPVSGSVYALDPDIPLVRQRIRLAAIGRGTERLRLDGRDMGPASGAPMVLPGPGQHFLALVDPAGRVVDRSLFSVR